MFISDSWFIHSLTLNTVDNVDNDVDNHYFLYTDEVSLYYKTDLFEKQIFIVHRR